MAELKDDAPLAGASCPPEVVAASAAGGALPRLRTPNLLIPFVPEKLRLEVRAFGERVGARFVDLGYGGPDPEGGRSDWCQTVPELATTPMWTTALTGYWDMLDVLWTGEDDFIVLEEDVLPTSEMIREMWACPEPWCSGTFGRWHWAVLCARPDGVKPCGEPPGRCGQSDMSPEKAARIAACPLRLAGRKVLVSDSWLACVRFGSIRGQIPDLLARAAAHCPGREWWTLDRALFRILYDDELLSPHLHFPPVVHLKAAGPNYDDPWGAEQYAPELAERASAAQDSPG